MMKAMQLVTEYDNQHKPPVGNRAARRKAAKNKVGRISEAAYTEALLYLTVVNAEFAPKETPDA